MENHMPYVITQFYLPPGSGDFPALTPAEAGIWFSDPRRMIWFGWLLYPEIVYPQNTVIYLRADCLYTRSAQGPTLGNDYGSAFFVIV